MPHSFEITGCATRAQIYRVGDKDRLMRNIVFIRTSQDDPFQLYIQFPNLNLIPNKAQYIMLSEVAINGIPLMEWLRSYHDDANVILDRFSEQFTKGQVLGDFTIQVSSKRENSLSYAAVQYERYQEDYFVQDNMHEVASASYAKLRGGLHV